MSEQAAALNPQAAHFARVHSAYVESYYDPPSMEYRRRFLTPLILRDIDLNGKTVADIGCGGGANSADLIHTFPGAVLFGFDIVSELTSLYTAETGRPAYCLDFTTPLPAEFCGRFDYVFALGVLHHMVRGLDTAMKNIHAMLKPGGIVVAVEPSSRFFLEHLRKVWYRLDPSFDSETEAAIDAQDLSRQYADKFETLHTHYVGGPAFFLILQSMVLRIPYGLKTAIAKPSFLVESWWNKIPMPQLKNMFVVHMRRK